MSRRLWTQLVLLGLLSLALRAGVFVGLGGERIAPLYDEAGYLTRAMGWLEWLQSSDETESVEAARRAYGGGNWPPGQPIVLAVGLLVGGGSELAARLLVLLLGALTTPLTFLVARHFTTDRGAWAAAWLHLLYPTFVTYAHFLWTETTTSFLLLAAMACAFSARRAKADRHVVLGELGAGVCLGVAALTHANALVLAVALALWTLWDRAPAKRLARTLRVVGPMFLLVSLWLGGISRVEGRWVGYSTLSSWNLALGQNPWIPAGLSSSWGHEPSKSELRREMEQRARSHAGRWEFEGGPIARDALANAPLAAATRVALRLRMLWAPDFFPARHLLHGAHRALPDGVALIVLIVGLMAYLALTFLIAVGTAQLTHARRLLLGLVAVGCILPLLTVSFSRLHLPLLALLLPAAGHGLDHLRSTGRFSRRAGGAWLVFALLSLSALPEVWRLHLQPSAHYLGLFSPLDSRLGIERVATDLFELRRLDSRAPIRLTLGPDATFGNGQHELNWPADRQWLRLFLVTNGSASPVLRLDRLSASPATHIVQPVQTQTWQQWNRAGDLGVELRWLGAGPPRSLVNATLP